MAHDQNVKLLIAIKNSDLDEEELEKAVQTLFLQIREMNEVESVNRVFDSAPPEGNKSLGGFIVGVLTAEVNFANAKAVFRFLGDRLGGKDIELEVEANGKKLKVKASSREELDYAIRAAQDFIKE
ncbi:hypothetical protein [Leptolyngbya ohadii]|uniref:hypothetical protein n=1 Tax=Leptolyngbya ohadii TaxID=1962290 RepID=UPI000B5A02FB|nr:hypothetical protein [Leptolyngbya ohadii]